MVSGLAILAIRNEQRHIGHILGKLIDEGLEVVLLDDGPQEDDSISIARKFLSRGLLEIQTRIRSAEFDLRAQLEWKSEVAETYPHQWIVHVDADEWLQDPREGKRLIDLIQEADDAGANVIDFQEFTFVPTEPLRPGEDPREVFNSYYFHEPKGYSYQRAWKNSKGLQSLRTGGHTIEGAEVRIFETKGLLRHYPILDQLHLEQKYGNRQFPKEELDMGWHADRVALAEWKLVVENNAFLRKLDSPLSKNFDRSNPTSLHFWYPEWSTQKTALGRKLLSTLAKFKVPTSGRKP